MKPLIVQDPYNADAQDFRREFNSLGLGQWIVVPQATSLAISLPLKTKIVEIGGTDNLFFSPNPISSPPTPGNPTTGQFFLNQGVIVIENETNLYVFCRNEAEIVVNFYGA